MITHLDLWWAGVRLMNRWIRKITFWSVFLSVTQSYAEGGRSADALGQGGTGPEPELWVLLMTCFTVLGFIWRNETQKKLKYEKHTVHGQDTVHHQTIGQTKD